MAQGGGRGSEAQSGRWPPDAKAARSDRAVRRYDVGVAAGGARTGAGTHYRIGALSPVPRAAVHNALYDELSRLGFVEGQNLQTDRQGYGLRPEQFRQQAAELAKAKVDVLVCVGAAAIRAAQRQRRLFPSSVLPTIWSAKASYVPWHILAAIRPGQHPRHRTRR